LNLSQQKICLHELWGFATEGYISIFGD
jgi:hypothetical protein